MITKTKNYPIILASHEYPRFNTVEQDIAFATRVKRTRFGRGKLLDMDRVAATILESLESQSRLRLGAREIPR